MNVLKLLLCMISVLIGVCAMAQTNDLDGKTVKDAEVLEGEFDEDAWYSERNRLYELLMDERPFFGQDHLELVPDSAALEQLSKEPDNSPRLRVGINLQTDFAMDFGNAWSRAAKGEIEHAGGSLSLLATGGFSWLMSISSPGAKAMRVHLEKVRLPAGVSLYFYNDHGDVDGPYTERGPNRNGTLWSDVLSGDRIYVQMRSNALASRRSPRFHLTEIAYLGTNYVDPSQALENQKRAYCNTSSSCIKDGSCYSTGAVSNARNAVARILYSSGGSQFLCSGSLIADHNSGSQIPFFLTARHCINSRAEANSANFTWRYRTSSCDAVCSSVSNYPRTNGADFLDDIRQADASLLHLNSNPPAGSTFLGWSVNPISGSNNTNLYRISHPNGNPQAYSHHRVATSRATCTNLPRGNYIYSQTITGATTGGSSGSPVLDSNGRIRGQLYGSCGTNTGNDCDFTNNSTVDGALAAWPYRLLAWMEDPNTSPTACRGQKSSCDTGCYWDCEVDGRCDPYECEDECETNYLACVFYSEL